MGAPGSGRVRRGPPMIAADGTELWDMQPVDTEKAFNAFCVYRDMGSRRTLQLVAASLGKRPAYETQLQVWSRENHWVQRTSAWDAYQDKVKTDAILEAKRKAASDMVERHLSIAEQIQSLASVELMRWIHRLKVDVPNPDLTRKPGLRPGTLQMLLDYAIKLERLNRDEPESIHEVRDKSLDPEVLEERIKHLLGARDEK